MHLLRRASSPGTVSAMKNNVAELLAPLVPLASAIRACVIEGVQEAEDRLPLKNEVEHISEFLRRTAISHACRLGIYQRFDAAAAEGRFGRVESYERNGFLLRLLPDAGVALRFGKLTNSGGRMVNESEENSQPISELRRAFCNQLKLPIDDFPGLMGLDVGYTRSARDWSANETLVSMTDMKGKPLWSVAIPSDEVLAALGHVAVDESQPVRLLHDRFQVVVEPQTSFAGMAS